MGRVVLLVGLLAQSTTPNQIHPIIPILVVCCGLAHLVEHQHVVLLVEVVIGWNTSSNILRKTEPLIPRTYLPQDLLPSDTRSILHLNIEIIIDWTKLAVMLPKSTRISKEVILELLGIDLFHERFGFGLLELLVLRNGILHHMRRHRQLTQLIRQPIIIILSLQAILTHIDCVHYLVIVEIVGLPTQCPRFSALLLFRK